MVYVVQETWLAMNARLSALRAEQPEGALAPADTMTQTSLEPPQSPGSSIAHDQEVDRPSSWLFESPSNSDNAVNDPEDVDASMDVSDSQCHSPGKPRYRMGHLQSLISDWCLVWPLQSRTSHTTRVITQKAGPILFCSATKASTGSGTDQAWLLTDVGEFEHAPRYCCLPFSKSFPLPMPLLKTMVCEGHDVWRM